MSELILDSKKSIKLGQLRDVNDVRKHLLNTTIHSTTWMNHPLFDILCYTITLHDASIGGSMSRIQAMYFETIYTALRGIPLRNE